MQIAGEIARLQGLPTRIDTDLRERCFGGFEGQLYMRITLLVYPGRIRGLARQSQDAEFLLVKIPAKTIRRFLPHASCLASAIMRGKFSSARNRHRRAWRRVECVSRSWRAFLNAKREVTILMPASIACFTDGQFELP